MSCSRQTYWTLATQGTPADVLGFGVFLFVAEAAGIIASVCLILGDRTVRYGYSYIYSMISQFIDELAFGDAVDWYGNNWTCPCLSQVV